MAVEQVITIAFGRESFSQETASLSAFVVTHPFTRTLPSKAFPRQGQLQVFPASNYPEVNGNLFMDTVKCPEGTLIALQYSHKRGASPLLDAAIFLRLRASGPMLAVHVNLPAAREALHTGRFLAFQGRADLVTREQCEDMGIEIPAHWARAFLDEEEVDEAYSVSTLAPETAPPPRLETVQVGEEVVAIPARRGRRINSRR